MRPEARAGESATDGAVTGGRTLKPIPQLDGLRGVAVLMVYLNHACRVPGLWVGVDLFFILSGYLITNILLRDAPRMSFSKMIRGFYVRRAERILPAYLMILLLAALTLKIDWQHVWWWYAFFLQNVPTAWHLNVPAQLVPLWSLGVEQHFYLVWPILIYFTSRRHLKAVLYGLLILTPIARAIMTLFSTSDGIVNAFTPFRMDAIATGALFALVVAAWPEEPAIFWAKVSLAAGLALWIAFAALDPRWNRLSNAMEFNTLVYSFNILAMGGLFVWALLSDGMLVKMLKWSWLRWMGRISYMFYLVHVFVLMALEKKLSRGAAILPAFVISFAVASASWLLVEKPVLSLSASHRRKAAAVAA